MWKRNLLLIAAAWTMAACASGTPIRTTPRCSFDLELLEASPERLPAATAGDLGTLRLNREDSKLAYRELYLKHRDLSEEVRSCLATQGSDPDRKKSALDLRIERMEGRTR
jgi:hypothetical protein